MDNQDSISISAFKATCLKLLVQVKNTGRCLLVTKRGEPIALITPPVKKASEASWLGSMKNRGELEGEILSPAGSPEDWEGLN
ncbi:MAG: hypothetical protein A2284_14640 [Deltaproteobacteria bacterium RIFOXYA12_FULL_61_11]|nr:MAG: hypothetical protein A2284_14640 [Deltaproteobacteria bacterium RIFOXYA12_FULL_61_11]